VGTYGLLNINQIAGMEMDNFIFELEPKVVVNNFNKPSHDLSYFN
jgi:hypothetical protein